MPGGIDREIVARAVSYEVSWQDVLSDLRTRGWATIPLDRVTHAAYDRLVAHAHWFFGQPDEDKRALDISASDGHRGWVSPDQAGDYEDEGPRRYEAFDIGRTPTTSDRIEHPLRGENRWPGGADGAALANDAEAMFAYLERLSETVGDAICDDLGISREVLRRLRTEPVSQLRLIRYFELHEAADASADRAAMGAHTDYEFFTILFQNSPGTQVLGVDGKWTDVPHTGVVTLLAGDMLTVFSGGRYQSVLHRAGPEVSSGRISIPYFAGADYSAQVSNVVGTGETICFGTHLLTQLRRDFPYLRDADPDFVIDLTGRGRRSAFESRAWSRVLEQQPCDEDQGQAGLQLQPLE